MRKAFVELELKQGGTTERSVLSKASEIITASHYYVLFKPRNEAEIGKLMADSTIDYYSYPMDVKLPENFSGTEYSNYQKSIGAPEYYYASVPVEKVLPDVPYEKLEDLYIPDDYSDDKKASDVAAKLNNISIEALVQKSMDVSGNIEGANTTVNRAVYSTWRPSGRIRSWDTDLNRYVGLEGLKVKAKRWFTTHVGFCDANGDFTCDGTFKRPADYSFNWERYDFEIRNAGDGKPEYTNNNETGPLMVDFENGTHEAYNSIVFRAPFTIITEIFWA